MPIVRAQLRHLARERRSLHIEGLLAVLATVGLVVASQVGARLIALAPVAMAYGAMTARWVIRFLELLGRCCPRCGEPFFYSRERLLYSLPYLSRRCAHCREPLSGHGLRSA